MAGSVPPGVAAGRLRAADRRAARRSGCRRCSTPTASRCAPACAPSPPSSRRTSARPRRRSATSSTTPTTSPWASPACSRWAPARRSSPRDRLRRDRRRGVERRRYEVEDRAARAGADGRLRRLPSSPATSPRATRAPRPRECLAYGVACGAESTQHFGAGSRSTARGRAAAAAGRGARARGPGRRA